MPFSRERLELIDAAVKKHNAGIKLGAYDEQKELIAASYLVWDQDKAYYLIAGDNDKGRESSASHRLCREAMNIAFEEKQLKQFDFCGSMIESISEVRRQFGARIVPLMKIYKAKYRLLDIIYNFR